MDEQLKRLQETLQDMAGMWKPFGFGLLWPSPAATISPAIWKLAEEGSDPAFAYYEPGSLHSLPVKSWLDPTPDRTYCIRWWGDQGGVEAFKGWCEKVWGCFNQHPNQAPELFVPRPNPGLPSWVFSFQASSSTPLSGYYWTLNAFCMVAVKNPHLTLTKTHEVLDTANIQVEQADVQVIPTKPRSFGDNPPELPAVKISFLEFEADAITFGSWVLDQLVADEAPALHVDVANGVIYVNGIPVAVDRLHAQIVAEIAAGNGRSVSGTEIMKKLNLVRIGRTIKKLPKEVRDQIKSDAGKGYRDVMKKIGSDRPIEKLPKKVQDQIESQTGKGYHALMEQYLPRDTS